MCARALTFEDCQDGQEAEHEHRKQLGPVLAHVSYVCWVNGDVDRERNHFCEESGAKIFS